jgi:hypothetical protein
MGRAMSSCMKPVPPGSIMLNDFGRVSEPCGDCQLHADEFYHCTMNCSGAKFMPAIEVHFIYPPIPLRQFDWCAYYEGTEPDDDGNFAAGYGKTRKQAIDELLANFPRE